MSQIEEFKCPNCGASLTWDASNQTVRCPYCNGEFSIEAVKQANEVFADTEDNTTEDIWGQQQQVEFSQEESDGLNHYVCQNCGGEIITDKTTSATKCPYCDSNIVLSDQVKGMFRPDRVIPFKLDRQQAIDRYYKHLLKKPFLPDSFKGKNLIDEIKGVYVPFFMFDGEAKGRMRFNATRTRSYRRGDYDITETAHYMIYRAGRENFRNIPVKASNKAAEELMQSIEPFDFSSSVDFETAYLAGYLADKYDVSTDVCKLRANERIRNSLASDLRSTIGGYDSVSRTASNITVSNPKVQYALLPVWMLNTTYQGKQYRFVMNGQTGRFVGDLPIDKGKYVRTLLLITVLLTAVSTAIWHFVIGG